MKSGGVGGANTNKSGLKFEENTDLSARITRDLVGKISVNQISVEQSVISSESLVF